MDDAELSKRLEALEKKVDAVFVSAEKTRKYFLILMIASVVAFVIPLIGLVFTIPTFISTYQSMVNF